MATAEELFGAQSVERHSAEIQALRPDQLEQLRANTKRVRVIHTGKPIPQVMQVPDVQKTGYYRKRLLELDEAIASMALSLATGKALPPRQ